MTLRVPAAAAAVLVLALGASATELAPHRAYYDIKLKDSVWGAGITNLTGRLVVEFNNSCDGYTLNQRFVTETSDSEGKVVISDLWLTSWESADGTSFRFNLKNEIDGTVVESFNGKAAIAAKGQSGQVAYDGKEKKTADLPTGTIFPPEHASDLVRAALAGDAFLSRTVFDGSGEGEVYSAHAVIGRERPAELAGGRLAQIEGASAYSDARAWPVTLSYYDAKSRLEMPDYESSFVMYSNGVSSDLVLDYGDFSVTGTLTRVEPLPAPKC